MRAGLGGPSCGSVWLQWGQPIHADAGGGRFAMVKYNIYTDTLWFQLAHSTVIEEGGSHARHAVLHQSACVEVHTSQWHAIKVALQRMPYIHALRGAV